MLNKKLNAKLLWMQFEDVLAPRLGLTVKERAVLLVSAAPFARGRQAPLAVCGYVPGPRSGSRHRSGAPGGAPARRAGDFARGQALQNRPPRRDAPAGEDPRAPLGQKWGVNDCGTEGRGRASCLDARNHGFLENLGAPQSHSRSRTRRLLLLPSPHSRSRARPRPRCATRALRAQFLPQPGFLLSRMQLAQG